MSQKDNTQNNIPESVKDLVIERINVLDRDSLISFGDGNQEYTPDQLIFHVQNNDPIGMKMVELQMNYLRALKDGVLLDDLISTI